LSQPTSPMARNTTHKKKKVSKDPSYRKKKPLGYFPVTRKMQITCAAGGVGLQPNAYGDAGSILSRMNNRLYRYGKMYDLKIDMMPSVTPGTVVEIYALSNTWYVQKAFEEAKSNYDMAYENEVENINETNIGRWRDFRIRTVNFESFSGFYSAVFPVVANTSTVEGSITGGSFIDSMVEESTGTQKRFTWALGDANNYSVMEEYDKAGNQSRSPATGTGTMPYAELEADSSAVEGAALQTDGQDPPYNATAFPNAFVKVGELTVGTNGSQKLSTGYFHAPCGVFIIRSSTGNVLDLGNNLSLEVRSGDYKGVSAHNMERM